MFRRDSNRPDNLWCDLIDSHQNIFRFLDDTASMYHNGKWNDLPGQAVIDRWPFGGDLLTPKEIVVSMGLGKTMPTVANLETYVLGRKLLYPSAQHSIEFEYNSDPPPPGNRVVSTGQYVIRRHRHERGRDREDRRGRRR